jgi:hypothetical protein
MKKLIDRARLREEKDIIDAHKTLSLAFLQRLVAISPSKPECDHHRMKTVSNS